MDYTEEQIDLRSYWLILRRRWLPALTVFGVVVLLTTTVGFLQQKTAYQSKAKLLVEQK